MAAAEQPLEREGLSEVQKGALCCVLAHLVWGGMAFYFGLIRYISPPEIAVHRGLWSLPIAGLVLWIILWAVDVKPFDAFLLTLGMVIVAATLRMIAPYLPGNRPSPDEPT